MNTNKLIKNIIDNDLCIGCGLCAGVDSNVEMVLSAQGFLIPTLEATNNSNFNIINNCCPGINTYENNKPETNFWGEIIGCYTGYSNNQEIRYAGSSGGAITGIVTELLANNTIDAVLQVGPNFNKSPFFNEVYFNTTYEEIIQCSSSRYAPSSPLMNINEILDKDLKFAFIGKPCDITSLRNLSKFDIRINKNIKYMFSFFCAGLPSEHASNNILKKMNIDKNNVKTFRYRGNGWPGKTVASLQNGENIQITYNESWGKVLNKKIHFRCKICPDSIGMCADIVAADAWYSKGDGYPDFKEKDGRSLIISRTHKGEAILQSLKNENILTIKNLNQNEIYAMQPGQVKKREDLFARFLAIKINPFQMVPKYIFQNIYFLNQHTPIINKLKAFLGMSKRLLKKQFFK